MHIFFILICGEWKLKGWGAGDWVPDKAGVKGSATFFPPPFCHILRDFYLLLFPPGASPQPSVSQGVKPRCPVWSHCLTKACWTENGEFLFLSQRAAAAPRKATAAEGNKIKVQKKKKNTKTNHKTLSLSTRALSYSILLDFLLRFITWECRAVNEHWCSLECLGIIG